MRRPFIALIDECAIPGPSSLMSFAIDGRKTRASLIETHPSYREYFFA